MKFGNLKYDKGVAGTGVLLALIVSLFIIGLLVMIFALLGGALGSTPLVSNSGSGSGSQNGFTLTDSGTSLTTCASSALGSLSSVTLVNATGGTLIAEGGNYTTSVCTISGVGASVWNGTVVNASYTYTYAGTAYNTINDTTTSIASVTTFFSLFIVIGSMVVLVLLTVIIIVSIRQSGMLNESTA